MLLKAQSSHNANFAVTGGIGNAMRQSWHHDHCRLSAVLSITWILKSRLAGHGSFKILGRLRVMGTPYTLRPRQNGRHFADDIFKCIFLNENVSISIKISLMFVPKGPINNIPALVQIMAWRRPGDKPLSEPMMVNLSLGLNELNWDGHYRRIITFVLTSNSIVSQMRAPLAACRELAGKL